MAALLLLLLEASGDDSAAAAAGRVLVCSGWLVLSTGWGRVEKTKKRKTKKRIKGAPVCVRRVLHTRENQQTRHPKAIYCRRTRADRTQPDPYPHPDTVVFRLGNSCFCRWSVWCDDFHVLLSLLAKFSTRVAIASWVCVSVFTAPLVFFVSVFCCKV